MIKKFILMDLKELCDVSKAVGVSVRNTRLGQNVQSLPGQ